MESMFKIIVKPEAAIEGIQASVDALQLLSDGWCLKIEIVISKSIQKYLIEIYSSLFYFNIRM